MVTVTATDLEGLNSSVDVTIEVTDVDEAPEIIVGGLVISGMRSVERAEGSSTAVATYMVSGPNAASATWSLSGDDVGDFRISSSGVLTFRSAPDYDNPRDMNGDNVYMVTIMADDGTYMDTHDVVVIVTEMDDMVGPDPADPLLAEYDADKDMWIQLDEARAAVGDYFVEPKGSELSLADARKVIGLYFEYKNSQ